MSSVPNLPGARNTPSPSCFDSYSTASSSRQINRIFQRNISGEQQSMHLQQVKYNYKVQDKCTNNHFRPLMAPSQKELQLKSNMASPSGVHVFSLPVRRIRGLSAALNRLNMCEYVIETVGRIIEDREQEATSSNPYGVTFRLEEQVERARGVQLKCSFVDMDEVQPEVYYNRIYK